MEERRGIKRSFQFPLLEDNNNDSNGWYSWLKLKLDTNGLRRDFHQKEELPPSKKEESNKYREHVLKRKHA
ncbi:hypothetical protein GN958_ATG15091 [Phytophthora infestans]|uniref:Uncharacterized protein n=1 Tax=Phytophthora infestans TaxID=4787 RepID=A0A8S9U3R1_PHYIN|nr:hypothetical protein GN958_ATG15091 [Phytophthora infestans]